MNLLPPGFAWLAAGIALVVLEVFAPGAFMVWIGLAAIATGLAALAVDLTFAAEAVLFAAFAAIGIVAGLALRRRSKPARGVNTPGAGLVGRTAHALSFEGREGRVRLGDSDWPARLAGANGAPPLSSTRLEVVGVDGVVLLVRPVGDRPPGEGPLGVGRPS